MAELGSVEGYIAAVNPAVVFGKYELGSVVVGSGVAGDEPVGYPHYIPRFSDACGRTVGQRNPYAVLRVVARGFKFVIVFVDKAQNGGCVVNAFFFGGDASRIRRNFIQLARRGGLLNADGYQSVLTVTGVRFAHLGGRVSFVLRLEIHFRTLNVKTAAAQGLIFLHGCPVDSG